MMVCGSQTEDVGLLVLVDPIVSWCCREVVGGAAALAVLETKTKKTWMNTSYWPQAILRVCALTSFLTCQSPYNRCMEEGERRCSLGERAGLKYCRSPAYYMWQYVTVFLSHFKVMLGVFLS